MKILNHLKLVIITGFLLGLLMGTVDVIAKISVWSFQWFEFYQTLSSSIIIVTILFFLLLIFLQLFMKITKIKFSFETLYTFYFSGAVSFALFFYLLVLINRIFLINHTFSDFLSIKFNLGALALSIGIFVLTLFKGKKLVLKTIDFLNKKTTKKLLENYIFIVLVFILSSFLLDIYIINKTPVLKSDESVRGSPNILLIVLDTVRADHLTTYGYDLNTTPNLNELAKKSVVFENAVVPSTWSLPSHTSLFTGRYLFNHGTSKKNQFVGEEETLLPEILKDEGFITSGITANTYIKSRYGIAQGMMSYDERVDFFEYENQYTKFDIRSIFIALFSDIIERSTSFGDRTAKEINGKIFKWLDKNKDQTFYLFVNYVDLHHPYYFPEEFMYKFTDKDYDYDLVDNAVEVTAERRYEYVPDEIVDYTTNLYDGGLAYLDYNLGKLFERLGELGLMNNTIVIITADHGEEFYEHGGFLHASTMFEELLHVPLIIYYPEFSPKRVEERVSLVDIFPTVLDFLDIEYAKDEIDGISLLPLLRGNGNFKRDNFVISEDYGRPEIGEATLRALYDGDWKVIVVNLSDPDYKLNSSLFNLKNDPNESKNLYNSDIKKRDMLLGYLESMKKER
ncbi:sulfatase [Candidatus Woesearchaeota archaeon]|nr:sulfatase [Candidatus Woesearchaeota archaeon]